MLKTVCSKTLLAQTFLATVLCFLLSSPLDLGEQLQSPMGDAHPGYIYCRKTLGLGAYHYCGLCPDLQRYLTQKPWMSPYPNQRPLRQYKLLATLVFVSTGKSQKISWEVSVGPSPSSTTWERTTELHWALGWFLSPGNHGKYSFGSKLVILNRPLITKLQLPGFLEGKGW